MIAKNSSGGYFRTEGIVTNQLENNGEVHDGKQDQLLSSSPGKAAPQTVVSFWLCLVLQSSPIIVALGALHFLRLKALICWVP